MGTAWPSWFEHLLRNHLPALDDAAPLDPDRLLAHYGLRSLGCLVLADDLVQRHGLDLQHILPRTFSTASDLWSALTVADGGEVGAEPRDASPSLRGSSPAGGVAAPPAVPCADEPPLTLARRFATTADQHPEVVGLRAGAVTSTYRQLHGAACALAARIRERLGPVEREAGRPPRVAVLGARDAVTFTAYLGVLYAGATVVPLSMDSPSTRNALICDLAAIDLVVLAAELDDAEARGHADALVLDGLTADSARTILAAVEETRTTEPLPAPVPVPEDSAAYLLFTSGSTGQPKGVCITHRSVNHFLKGSLPRYAVGPGDVFSQCHELTFDLSVFELWGAWSSGATLVTVARVAALDPAATSRHLGVTVWTCTPSLMASAALAGRLEPGSMAGVQHVVFCGEPLTWDTAADTRRAAPHAVIDNTYGPTEATVWCTYQRLPATADACASGSGHVPIGQPCPDVTVIIVDVHGEIAETGELCLGGEQVFAGYLDPHLDEGRFLHHGGRRWYRTGDWVRRDEQGVLHHLGRIDDQVKVRGHRIELGEVEVTAARLLEGRRVVVVHVESESGADLVLCVEGAGVDLDRLRHDLQDTLPPYMVPRRLMELGQFPLTPHGKLDRAGVRAHLRLAVI